MASGLVINKSNILKIRLTGAEQKSIKGLCKFQWAKNIYNLLGH